MWRSRSHERAPPAQHVFHIFRVVRRPIAADHVLVRLRGVSGGPVSDAASFLRTGPDVPHPAVVRLGNPEGAPYSAVSGRLAAFHLVHYLL